MNTDTPEQRHRIPGFAKMMLFLGLVAVACTGLLVISVYLYQRAECQKEVAARAGQRTMWVWALEQNPDDELHDEAARELDLRLPELRCDGTRSEPVEPRA